MHLSWFSPQRRNEIHQSDHSSILSPVLSSSATTKPQKESFWCRFEKSSPGKNDSNWLNPLFSLSIKQATRPALDVRASWAPGRAAERISKAMFHNKQCSLQSPRHPDENIMFRSTELLQVNTWFTPACWRAPALVGVWGCIRGPRNRTERWWVAASQCQSWGVGRATFPRVLVIISGMWACVSDWDALLLRSMLTCCVWAHHFTRVMSRLREKGKMFPRGNPPRTGGGGIYIIWSSCKSGRGTINSEDWAMCIFTSLGPFGGLIPTHTRLFAYIGRSLTRAEAHQTRNHSSLLRE